MLVCHLEEKEIGELLDIVAIAYPVVSEDVTIIPQTLNNGRGGRVHFKFKLLIRGWNASTNLTIVSDAHFFNCSCASAVSLMVPD